MLHTRKLKKITHGVNESLNLIQRFRVVKPFKIEKTRVFKNDLVVSIFDNHDKKEYIDIYRKGWMIYSNYLAV